MGEVGTFGVVAWVQEVAVTPGVKLMRISPLRAKRAKPKSCRDDMIIAQGREARAPPWVTGRNMNSSPFSRVCRAALPGRSANPGKGEVGYGVGVIQGGGLGGLCRAIILLCIPRLLEVRAASAPLSVGGAVSAQNWRSGLPDMPAPPQNSGSVSRASMISMSPRTKPKNASPGKYTAALSSGGSVTSGVESDDPRRGPPLQTRRQTVDWSGLACEARFWERKLGPAKVHYL